MDVGWSGKFGFLMHFIHKFVPVKNVKDANLPPWIEVGLMEKSLIHFIRKKHSVLKKYRKYRTDYANES